ncbi:MAG: class I SAM-dependent methyltransferase [Clostridiales bacterium]|nr:class I SAM-dependent methyltransferase [Clostridiales bacterium]
MKEYDASTALWDEVFTQCKLEDLTGEKLEVEPLFDECLKLFSNVCSRVLDYGCGTGDVLFQLNEIRPLTYGLGIDKSAKGIEYCNEMTKLNHLHHLDFMVGDTEDLKQMDEESFDGIILSNVLDVVPEEVAVSIMNELERILVKGGYMFVKLNPYYSKEKMKEYGFKHLKDNLYTDGGVLRLRQIDTLTWHKIFEKQFEIERYLEFPYPWQEGMNRLFLLKKK